MNNADADKPEESLPKARVEKNWAFTWFWIVPVLALSFVGWLIYKNVVATGPTITIVFSDSKSLQEDNSAVKFHGANIGTVKKVTLQTNGLVAVEASLHKDAEHLARAGTEFWIVSPEVSLGEIRGLKTIVSGDYITLKPGNGVRTNRFKGLDEPPIVPANEPGFQLTLWSDKLGSIKPGSPVYYRDLEVGHVLPHRLTSDGLAFLIPIWIDEKFSSLVGTNSKFWHAGGLDVHLGLDGVSIKAATPKALLSGGIAFASPGGAKGKVSEKTMFQLYEHPLAEWTGFSHTNAAGSRITIHFKNAHGLSAGADLKYRNVKIGTVVQMTLDEKQNGIVVLADLGDAARFYARAQSQFWIVHPEISIGKLSGLQAIGSGDFIEVRPGDGKPQFEFTGLEDAPALKMETPGLRILLLSDNIGSVQKGTLIYFRGISVGQVLDFHLDEQSQAVEIIAQIEEHYAPLVRKNSKFYNVGGVHADIGLLQSDIRSQSFRTLISGGIAFATPDTLEPPAPDGLAFRLYEKPEDEWLGWAPAIKLSARNKANEAQP